MLEATEREENKEGVQILYQFFRNIDRKKSSKKVLKNIFATAKKTIITLQMKRKFRN